MTTVLYIFLAILLCLSYKVFGFVAAVGMVLIIYGALEAVSAFTDLLRYRASKQKAESDLKYWYYTVPALCALVVSVIMFNYIAVALFLLSFTIQIYFLYKEFP